MRAKAKHPKVTEEALAAAVVAWLQDAGSDVYQEVSNGGWSGPRADIVAVDGELVSVVETKTSLSIDVLEQAERWQVHYRWIAVPALKGNVRGRGFAQKLCAILGIGLIEVTTNHWAGQAHHDVRMLIPAPLQRQHHRKAKELRASLVQEQKTQKAAGTVGGGFWTPYRATMERVKRLLKDHPAGLTIKEIVTDTLTHYSSPASARSTMPGRLQTLEKDWCVATRVGRELRFFHIDHAPAPAI